MFDTSNLYVTSGGHPPQSDLTRSPASFTTAFALIPKGVIRDIVTSSLPFWSDYKCWILARPMSGFSETFSYYLVDLQPEGGSENPETEAGVESVVFVTSGQLDIEIDGRSHVLHTGGYVYLPPSVPWRIRNSSGSNSQFHWIRKKYQEVPGVELPKPVLTSIGEVSPQSMPGTDGRWTTHRFVDPADISHDMHVNIVSFEPGASIPFPETHVMEHGLFILEGKGLYLLNDEWIEVEAGDFLWLRAFCPQACYAGGNSPFRYLLYKDVNRHASF